MKEFLVSKMGKFDMLHGFRPKIMYCFSPTFPTAKAGKRRAGDHRTGEDGAGLASAKRITRLRALIEENQEKLLEAWHGHIGAKR